jgi:hypothetical protein
MRTIHHVLPGLEETDHGLAGLARAHTSTADLRTPIARHTCTEWIQLFPESIAAQQLQQQQHYEAQQPFIVSYRSPLFDVYRLSQGPAPSNTAPQHGDKRVVTVLSSTNDRTNDDSFHSLVLSLALSFRTDRVPRTRDKSSEWQLTIGAPHLLGHAAVAGRPCARLVPQPQRAAQPPK